MHKICRYVQDWKKCYGNLSWMDGKVSMLSKKAKFLVKLEMFQKKQPSPGWKTSGINYRVLIGKYLKHGPARLFFKALADKVLLEKGKQTKGSKNPNKDSPFHLPSTLPGEGKDQ